MKSMRVILQDGMKVDVISENFTIHTDQPAEAGGTQTAPAPYELFLASLAACAGFYVKRYCQTRGIPETGIELTQELLPGEDGRLETIRIRIHLPADFPPEHESAVQRAAAHCAVKKTISSPPAFEIVCERQV
jgi:ribosomal protein S12 methylthiotransferase accessory factor